MKKAKYIRQVKGIYIALYMSKLSLEGHITNNGLPTWWLRDKTSRRKTSLQTLLNNLYFEQCELNILSIQKFKSYIVILVLKYLNLMDNTPLKSSFLPSIKICLPFVLLISQKGPLLWERPIIFKERLEVINSES